MKSIKSGNVYKLPLDHGGFLLGVVVWVPEDEAGDIARICPLSDDIGNATQWDLFIRDGGQREFIVEVWNEFALSTKRLTHLEGSLSGKDVHSLLSFRQHHYLPGSLKENEISRSPAKNTRVLTLTENDGRGGIIWESASFITGLRNPADMRDWVARENALALSLALPDIEEALRGEEIDSSELEDEETEVVASDTDLGDSDSGVSYGDRINDLKRPFADFFPAEQTSAPEGAWAANVGWVGPLQQISDQIGHARFPSVFLFTHLWKLFRPGGARGIDWGGPMPSRWTQARVLFKATRTAAGIGHALAGLATFIVTICALLAAIGILLHYLSGNNGPDLGKHLPNQPPDATALSQPEPASETGSEAARVMEGDSNVPGVAVPAQDGLVELIPPYGEINGWYDIFIGRSRAYAQAIPGTDTPKYWEITRSGQSFELRQLNDDSQISSSFFGTYFPLFHSSDVFFASNPSSRRCEIDLGEFCIDEYGLWPVGVIRKKGTAHFFSSSVTGSRIPQVSPPRQLTGFINNNTFVIADSYGIWWGNHITDEPARVVYRTCSVSPDMGIDCNNRQKDEEYEFSAEMARNVFPQFMSGRKFAIPYGKFADSWPWTMGKTVALYSCSRLVNLLEAGDDRNYAHGVFVLKQSNKLHLRLDGLRTAEAEVSTLHLLCNSSGYPELYVEQIGEDGPSYFGIIDYNGASAVPRELGPFTSRPGHINKVDFSPTLNAFFAIVNTVSSSDLYAKEMPR